MIGLLQKSKTHVVQQTESKASGIIFVPKKPDSNNITMTPKILFLCILLIAFSQSFSQSISGIVKDKSNNDPLKNVNIYFEKSTIGTSTNSEGKFQLDIPNAVKKREKITFSCVGYADLQIMLKDIGGSIVYLTREIQQIDEVVIANKQKLKSNLHFEKVTKLDGGLYAFGAFMKDDKIYIIGGDESLGTDAAQAFRDAANKGAGRELSFSAIVKEMGATINWQNFSQLLQVYNLKSNTWYENDTLFIPRAYHSAVCCGNKVLVFGGTSLKKNKEYLSDKIEFFDSSTHTVRIDQSNPHQCVNFASGVSGNYVLAAGGSIKKDKEGIKQFSNKVHLFEMETGYWYEMTPLKTAKECKGTFVGTKFYVVGGNNGTAQSVIEKLDIETDKWETVCSLPQKYSYPALTAIGETIYGFENQKFFTYNTTSDVFRQYNINLNLTMANIFYSGNQILIVGGNKVHEYSNEPSRFIYSINMNEFSQTDHKKIEMNL